MIWWIIAIIYAALGFNLVRSRSRKLQRVPWLTFGWALLTSELAPQLLALLLLAVVAGWLGSANSAALLLLALAALPLLWAIYHSRQVPERVEQSLRQGLGANYQAQLSIADNQPLSPLPSWQRVVNPVGFAEPGVEVLRNIAYAPHGTRTQLDIYRPTQRPPSGCPVLLQIHGGAWMFGSKNEQGLPLMNYLASQGWICFAINYRLAPSQPFPTQIEDCKKALQWIRREGSQYGANPEFVAVSGGSAGGHLAALMAMTGDSELFSDGSGDTSIQAMVPFYGLYDLVPRGEQPNDELVIGLLNQRLFHQSPEQNPQLWESACPINYLQQPLPPAMVIHGQIDSLVPVNTAVKFVTQLSAASSNPVVYLELPATEHSFDVPNSWRSQVVVRGVHRFLEWARSRHYGELLNDDSASDKSVTADRVRDNTASDNPASESA